ncbi:UNVERIFIED_CONTAM: hypothetical protein PYX00_005615 [Menopon gallinae]|uniref:AT-rich interactive domain-containing protein 2 n=1 Tax=Menopon gallinae TaxID=328185 RepID=A0AAW2HS07_9NEOP
MDRFDDPKSYRQKRESFTRSLHHFHETRGTPFKKIPQFCGKEVDLFRLYNVVTQRGGWVKVNRTNQWDDILEEFSIPKGCVNGGNALKQIYLRYLDRYEKVHYLGESSDRHELDEEDIETRHRRWSTRSMHTVPLTYNHHQHVVVDNLRKFNGLSSDIYRPSEYDRLALSLVSPLPNEQDFAINVCTLLSNEGKHNLKLEKCPRIVDYLLAHAGVYNHSNLRVLFEEIYGKVRGHSLNTFWSDVLESEEYLDLTDENKFVKKPPRRLKVIKVVPKSPEYAGSDYPRDMQNLDQGSAGMLGTNTSGERTMPEMVDISRSDNKENDTIDVRLSNNESSENTTNSIDETCLKVQNPFVCSGSSIKDNPNLGAEKRDKNVLIDLTRENLNEDLCLKVQGRESDLVSVIIDEDKLKSNCLEKSVNNNGVEVCAISDKANSPYSVLRGECRTSAETDEERKSRDEESGNEAREREEEERKRKEEEERVRAAEEARKLEKELKEAEIYEAMLKEELRKKKKGYCFEEAPAKKARKSEPFLKIEPEDKELFALGRENGTRDYIGQRVLQVAHILRNLTFCEESMQVMAKNTTFIRFLLLCCNSRWSSLHQLGLDMLGNVSPELIIEDPSVDRIYQAFFCTIHRGIGHPNRFYIISCLEILNKICQKDENEDVISRNLDQCVYDQVCRLLSLHDIMILLYTLECLYSMSSMGEKACTYICRSKGAVEMLLALVTVEAQSYGPKACILMRVIETVSGTPSSNPQPAQPPPPASPGPGPPLTGGTVTAAVTPNPTMVTTSTMTVQPQPLPKLITQNVIRTATPKTVVGVMPMAAVATPVQIPTKVCAPLIQMPTVQQQHAHQQTVQENEQFALAWIRANFELSAGGKVEQQDLYKRYLDSCAKMGRKGVIAALHFPRFVRSVFGGTVGPKSHPIPTSEVKPGGPVSQSFYEGIKVRDVPLTINIKLVPVTEVPRPMAKKRPQTSTPKPKARRKKAGSPPSPILKAQLISPNKSVSTSTMPSSSASEGKVQVSTQTHLGQALLGQSTSPPSTPPPLDNSTLIKSLLATKVSETCMNPSFGMLSDNSQVTQRQQQQKILQQQNQMQSKPESPTKNKLSRINGVIQETLGTSPENHLVPTGVKGKKEPPQPPPGTNAGGVLRPKTPKLDTEDSDSMASTSRDCPVTGGGNTSADDNDNSLTSFEGIFNGLQESLDIDAPSLPEPKQFQNKLNPDDGKKEENGLKSGKSASEESGSQPEKKAMTDEPRPNQTQSKSLMLADLLDKKESPALNGVLGKDLRIGEKGLELVEKAILKETHLNNKDISVNCKKDSVVSVNGDTRTGGDECVTVIGSEATQCGNKRAGDAANEDSEVKRLKLDTEEDQEEAEEGGKNNVPKEESASEEKKAEKEDVNGDEEVRASSKAANLFAALAAEALEDETDLEVPSDPDPQPQTVMVPGGQIRPVFLGESSPLIVTAAGTRQIIMAPGQLTQQGQVLFSTGNQSLPVIVQNQRIVQGNSGQMLVTSQPQQFIMSGSSQSQMLIAQPQTALVQGQPQTLLVAQAAAQQPGTKTIIILQPQSQGNSNSQQQQQKMVVTSQGPQMVVTTPVARTVVQPQPTPPPSPAPPPLVGTTDVVLNSGIQNNPPLQNGSQIQIISSGVQNNAPILNQTDKSKTGNNAAKPVPGAKPTEGNIYLCEWRGCMRSFKTANEVYMHVCSTHCPTNPEQETQCLWERCDSMKRKRFSLMTHLHDRHCNAEVLNMMAARRKQLSTQGRTEIPAPAAHPPHPGYAPNAAFHAIKRHALEFVNPKELLDDNEGPVTKSIRLTASLILRNLVIYSSIGRRFLKGYEPHLASIALSNVESSRTIAQVLADLNDTSSR